jgi:hypothetical protein
MFITVLELFLSWERTMQIISRKARIVCVTVATLTSATILGSTVLGLTSSEPAPVALAQLLDGGPVPVATAG